MPIATSQCVTETVFDFTWKQVVQAFWNRYPNPSSNHVLTEDTISREVRDGKLYSRRLLSKTNPVPKWGKRLYNNVPIKIVEDSILDPKRKILTTFTRNIGFKKIMKVDEVVEYSEQKDGRTLAVRRAYISSQVFGFSRAIRAFGVERFKSNCNKTSSGFNYVLRHMFPQDHVIDDRNSPHILHSMEAPVITKTDQLVSATANAGKMDGVKNACRTSYAYVKNQANKLAQRFSVSN